MPVRVGVVGVNTSHAAAFTQILNRIDHGVDDGDDHRDGLLAEARVVAVWPGEHRDRAERLCRDYDVPLLTDDLDRLAGAVDVALVLDDTGAGARHAELAGALLDRGLDVFVDKPMTRSVIDAERLFAVAERRGATVMSCSALRFAAELRRFRTGDHSVRSVTAVGPNDWFYYGIHPVEAALTVLGGRPAWVECRTLPDPSAPVKEIAVVGWADGRSAVVQVHRDAAPGFHLDAYGPDGAEHVDIVDADAYYSATLREFLGAALGRWPALEPAATLAVLAVLEAGQRSAADDGRRVALA